MPFWQLYQIYGRRTPKDIHDILTKYKSSYIILEDSICLAPSKGCRTPDIVDIDNGVVSMFFLKYSTLFSVIIGVMNQIFQFWFILRYAAVIWTETLKAYFVLHVHLLFNIIVKRLCSVDFPVKCKNLNCPKNFILFFGSRKLFWY